MLEIQSSKIVLTLVDTETGELFTKEATFGDFKEATKKATTTRTRKPKTDDEPTPMIHLLEGKWQLNTKAIELTGFEPEMKLDIKFEKKGRLTTPILCQDDKTGNRLTKTYTVSCRGSKHDNLAEYGDTFVIEPYENKDGYFKLKGNIEKEDDIIDVPEEITDPETFDEDLDSSDDTTDIGDFELEL
jgi:hypothetical protein